MTRVAVVVLAVFPCMLHSGTPNLTAFLRTADDDAKVAERRHAVDLLESSGASVPFIDDFEVRVRNDAFDIERMRYTLRLEPSGFGEYRAARSLSASVLQLHRQRVRLSRHQALLDRYMQALELLEQEELAGVYGGLATLYADRVKVLENGVNGLDFKLDELIDAENDYTSLMLKNRGLNKRIGLLKEDIGHMLPDGAACCDFDADGLVGLDAIRERIQDTVFVLDTSNIYLQYEALQFREAGCRYAREKAEDRRYISYFEYSFDYGERLDELERWRDGKDYDVKQAHMLEVGFKVPGFNTDRCALNRRKLAFMADRENYEQLKRELTERIRKDSEDLKTLFEQYDYLAARVNDINAESSLKRYLQMEGVDPLILLDIKESVIKNAKDMVDVKYAIYRNYIRLMDSTGILGRTPVRNLLSADGEVIGSE